MSEQTYTAEKMEARAEAMESLDMETADMLRQAARMMQERGPSIDASTHAFWDKQRNRQLSDAMSTDGLAGRSVDRNKREPEEVTDDDLPGMWSTSDFTGGDPDERSFAARRATVPDGWKLVPIDATSAMQSAGGHVNSEWLNDNAPIGESRYGGPVMRSVWKAMLAAAPEVTK